MAAKINLHDQKWFTDEIAVHMRVLTAQDIMAMKSLVVAELERQLTATASATHNCIILQILHVIITPPYFFTMTRGLDFVKIQVRFEAKILKCQPDQLFPATVSQICAQGLYFRVANDLEVRVPQTSAEDPTIRLIPDFMYRLDAFCMIIFKGYDVATGAYGIIDPNEFNKTIQDADATINMVVDPKTLLYELNETKITAQSVKMPARKCYTKKGVTPPAARATTNPRTIRPLNVV